MRLSRSSGVLLHLTSLPSGRLGDDAYRFVDWLANAGQSWWQMLPLGPPDRYGSPYKSASAFACWRGFLGDPSAGVSAGERADFLERAAFWAPAWKRFGRGDLDDQVRFDREWAALRSYAASCGVRLIGDLPIYVAPGSADHRAWPSLFQEGVVAGTPPDAFSETGQLWGNPLYDWPALRRTGYRWWVERLRRMFELFDIARIDHFRGFVSYWSVPASASTALEGRWRRGPGAAVFRAAASVLGGSLPVIAEDLGVITPAVDRLRDTLGLPGMLVLQFGFSPGEPDSVHRFGRHVENRFVYTGTHDNDTALGWWSAASEDERRVFAAELSAAGVPASSEPWWDLIALAMRSVARVAIVQAQDVLGLDSSARMNDPGRRGGNWRWRLDDLRVLTPALARRLRGLTEDAGRVV